MNRILIAFLFCLLSTGNCVGQCTLIIHQVGVPTDTIFVANYEDRQPQKINDSTYRVLWDTSVPERICLVLDRPTRWWMTVWIEPDIKHKEIIIDYTKKEMRLINGSLWDSVCLAWMGKFPYHGDSKTDSVAVNFVKNNPDSYLSLFFLTHGIFHDFPEKRKASLNTLSPRLKAYPEFKQALASLNERKYPVTGDPFKEFSLPDMKGTVFNSASIKNKWILLNFWSNGCGPCIKEIDEFVKLYNSIDSSKVEFISISLDDDETKWRTSKNSARIPWRSLWTSGSVYCDLCLNYNLFSMPFFILFDKEKKLFYIKDGAGELQNIQTTLKENGLLNK